MKASFDNPIPQSGACVRIHHSSLGGRPASIVAGFVGSGVQRLRPVGAACGTKTGAAWFCARGDQRNRTCVLLFRQQLLSRLSRAPHPLRIRRPILARATGRSIHPLPQIPPPRSKAEIASLRGRPNRVLKQVVLPRSVACKRMIPGCGVAKPRKMARQSTSRSIFRETS